MPWPMLPRPNEATSLFHSPLLLRRRPHRVAGFEAIPIAAKVHPPPARVASPGQGCCGRIATGRPKEPPGDGRRCRRTACASGCATDATSPTCWRCSTRSGSAGYASARGPFASAAELEAWLSAVTCAKRYETVAVLGRPDDRLRRPLCHGRGPRAFGLGVIGVREEFQARGVGARLLKTLIGAATVVSGCGAFN